MFVKCRPKVIAARMNTPSSNLSENDSKAVLQLGERALAQLAMQFRAAQIEARKAELELKIEQAYRGDPAPLQQWLSIHGAHLSTEAPKTAEPKSLDATLKNWESLRRWAVLRLSKRQQSPSEGWRLGSFSSLRSDQPTFEKRPSPRSQLVSKATPDSSIPDSSIPDSSGQGSTPEADSSSDSRPSLKSIQSLEAYQDRVVKSKPQPIEPTPIEPTPQPSVGESLLEQESAELLAQLKLGEPPATEIPNRKRRWRGALVSTAFHAALVLVLAAISLDSPVKDGLLSLVASETSSSVQEDSFELTKQLDVQEPLTEPVDITTPVSQPNLSDTLPSADASLAQALSQTMASASSGDSKSTMMSAKAKASSEMVSFYGAESSGNSFCFVLDGSGSMRGGPWEAARIELLRSIGSLKPTQKFYIIFFNDEVMAITEPTKNQPARSPLYATPENIAHAKRWLDTLQIMTGQPPMKALEAALQIECDCVYFLADGEMSDSVAKKLLETLRKRNRADDIIDGEVVLVPIHTIAYYSDKGLDIMRRIAQENRGQFAYVPKPSVSKPSTGRKN